MDQLTETLQEYDIALSEDEVGREVARAIELSGGLPEYARALLGPGAPLESHFVEIVAETLGQTKDAGPRQQLTPEQIRLFQSGFGRAPVDPRAKAVLELAAMRATALTIEQAAEVFGASAHEVQGWVDERGLYGIEAGAERLLPIFQLDERGHPLPHIREVLPHLSRSIHPVGVLHWFTEPNPDLASEETHYAALSPRNWLMRELPAEPVLELAKHVA